MSLEAIIEARSKGSTEMILSEGMRNKIHANHEYFRDFFNTTTDIFFFRIVDQMAQMNEVSLRTSPLMQEHYREISNITNRIQRKKWSNLAR